MGPLLTGHDPRYTCRRAFADGDNSEISDDDAGKWIKTNSEIHAEKAEDREDGFG
jgi:hypothetical protein